MVQAINSAITSTSDPLQGSESSARGTSRGAVRLAQALGRKLDAQDPTVIRETAAQLVAEMFFKPLLAEMREFPFGRELATGGQTESAFGQLLDERVADTTAASDKGLTASIIHHLEEHARRLSGGDAAQATRVQLQGASEQGAL